MSLNTPTSREYTNRPGVIPPAIRRRYGYPAPLRGRTDDLEDQLAALASRVQQLELCHACVDGSHEPATELVR